MDIIKKNLIWRFIGDELKKKGQAPTFQEIADKVGLKHRQRISYYTDQLKADGLITIIAKSRHSIKLTNKGKKRYENKDRI